MKIYDIVIDATTDTHVAVDLESIRAIRYGYADGLYSVWLLIDGTWVDCRMKTDDWRDLHQAWLAALNDCF